GPVRHRGGISMQNSKRRLLCVSAIALVLTATVAAQAWRETAPARVHGGVLPVRWSKPRFFGASNAVLDYHGGPVMHTSTTFTIYWTPRGSTWQSGYMGGVDGFFANVAAYSGPGDNPYSTLMQYYDSRGHVAYRSTFAGSYVD